MVTNSAVQILQESLLKGLLALGLQVECHPYFRNEEMIQWCKSKQIHVTAYSPLGSPDSASMFKRKAPLLLQDPMVGAVASNLGRSPAQVYSKTYFRALCNHATAQLAMRCRHRDM